MTQPKIFESHKLVKPTPMNRADYNIYRGWELPADEDGADEGYLVEYLDGGKPNDSRHEGYISWSPKEQFDNGYKEVIESNYVSRLYVENDELRSKFDKLNEFILSDAFDGLPEIDRKDLKEQRKHMKSYLEVLSRRVSRTCN